MDHPHTVDDFPYKGQSMPIEDVNKRFNNLKTYKYTLIKNQKYFIRNIAGNWYNANHLKYRNTILKNEGSDYDNYNNLSDKWADPVRMTYKRYDRELTPKQYWEQNKEFVITEAILNYGEETPYTLRETIYKLAGECTEFRPTVLAAFIKMYNAKRVLDPAAGSGSRLIAAMALGVEYVGVDPNSAIHPIYQEMINHFAAADKDRYQMIQSPFEDAILPDMTFDLIMSSLPYFTLEKYSDEDTQSISRYPTRDEWFNNFLIPILNKAWNTLEIGGHMCINLNDIFKKESYCKDMVDTFNREHRDAEFLGVISYSEFKKNNMPKSPQPVFCWVKH
jgi:DNA modification methylase